MIRLNLSPEQSATLQAAGENAFIVAVRRCYQPGDPASIGAWEVIAVPANHRRVIGALNVFGGTHEAKRIKQRPAEGHGKSQADCTTTRERAQEAGASPENRHE